MPAPGWYTDIIVEQLTLTFSLDNDIVLIFAITKKTWFWNCVEFRRPDAGKLGTGQRELLRRTVGV